MKMPLPLQRLLTVSLLLIVTVHSLSPPSGTSRRAAIRNALFAQNDSKNKNNGGFGFLGITFKTPPSLKRFMERGGFTDRPHPPETPPPLDLLKTNYGGSTTSATTNTATALAIDDNASSANGKTTPFFLRTMAPPSPKTVKASKPLAVVVQHEQEQQKADATDLYKEYTVAELKNILRDRHLPCSGRTKTALMDRLVEADVEAVKAERERLQRAAVALRRRIVDGSFKPLLSKEFEHGVNIDIIQGAAFSAAAVAALASSSVALAATAGLGAAYVAISPGDAGNAVRWVGSKAYETATSAAKMAQKMEKDHTWTARAGTIFTNFVHKAKASQEERARKRHESQEMLQLETQVQSALDEAAKAVAASTSTTTTSSVKAELTARALLQTRLALAAKDRMKRRTQKMEINARALLEMRLQLEAAERTRMLEDDARLAQEAEEARIAIEARMLAEEESMVALKLKHAALAEEDRRFEDARIAEVARQAEELGEADDFSEQDWLESIQAAKQSIEENVVGIDDATVDDSAKASWGAAQSLAKNLREPSSATSDVDMKALAKAARDAVEAFEREMQYEEEDKASQRAQWDREITKEQPVLKISPVQTWSKLTVSKLKGELQSRGLPATGKKANLVAALEQSDLLLQASNVEESLQLPEPLANTAVEMEELARAARAAVEEFENTNNAGSMDEPADDALDLDFSDLDMEELGRAAREAVARFEAEDEPSDEMLWQLENEQEELLASPPSTAVVAAKADFASMKVLELKKELKMRGLPVSGKKVDLIERLKSA